MMLVNCNERPEIKGIPLYNYRLCDIIWLHVQIMHGLAIFKKESPTPSSQNHEACLPNVSKHQSAGISIVLSFVSSTDQWCSELGLVIQFQLLD